MDTVGIWAWAFKLGLGLGASWSLTQTSAWVFMSEGLLGAALLPSKLPLRPQVEAPCAPCFCFFVWSGTPFPVPSAAWKRCLCNSEESGRWMVCGGRGRGQGQGQGQVLALLGGFRRLFVWGFHPHPRARLAAPTLPRPLCRAHLNQYPLSPSRVCALKGKKGAGGPPT